jgi:hypothetical protein
LFAPEVGFIWIEGSDSSTEEAEEFVQDHEVSLQAFVARGGRLFINSASNDEITMAYDGRSIGYLNPNDQTDVAVAVDPEHPVFKGPDTSIATTFEGSSFAHGRVTGPGLTPLLVGTENDGPVNGAVVLADYISGAGRVALGSLTAVQFQEPEDAAEALRINLLFYLLSPLPVPVPVLPVPPTTPTRPASPAALVTPLPPADKTKPQVAITGLPKGCVEVGFRFQVKVSDQSGVGVVKVKLDGKLLRKADGKAKPSRTFKVQVPDAKLDQPGRHKIKVIARDAAGNVKRQGAGFKVCE